MNIPDDITEIFLDLLRHFDSVDIAEAEFKKMIHEDPDLKSRYRSWCDENGSSEKRGFFDFTDEYLASRDSVWESLKDYNDEE